MYNYFADGLILSGLLLAIQKCVTPCLHARFHSRALERDTSDQVSDLRRQVAGESVPPGAKVSGRDGGKHTAGLHGQERRGENMDLFIGTHVLADGFHHNR